MGYAAFTAGFGLAGRLWRREREFFHLISKMIATMTTTIPITMYIQSVPPPPVPVPSPPPPQQPVKHGQHPQRLHGLIESQQDSKPPIF